MKKIFLLAITFLFYSTTYASSSSSGAGTAASAAAVAAKESKQSASAKAAAHIALNTPASALTSEQLAKLSSLDRANLMARGCYFQLKYSPNGNTTSSAPNFSKVQVEKDNLMAHHTDIDLVYCWLQLEKAETAFFKDHLALNFPLFITSDKTHPLLVTRIITNPKNKTEATSWQPQPNTLYTLGVDPKTMTLIKLTEAPISATAK